MMRSGPTSLPFLHFSPIGIISNTNILTASISRVSSSLPFFDSPGSPDFSLVSSGPHYFRVVRFAILPSSGFRPVSE